MKNSRAPDLFQSLRQFACRFDARVRQIPPGIPVAAIMVLWLAWLSRPFLLQGPLGYVRDFELGDAIFPQLAYIAETLRSGVVSFWLPSQGAGTDLIGNFNSPILNAIMFAALPAWLAHDLIFLLTTGIATIGCYLLLRRALNCASWTALLGGVLFSAWFLTSFGGLVFAYAAGPAFALSPLALCWLLTCRGYAFRCFALSAALGLAIAVGGHYSWSVFLLGGVFFCALLLAPHRFKIWFPHLVVIGAIVIIVQLPFFIANLQTAPLAARTFQPFYSWDQGRYSLGWRKFLAPLRNYYHNPPFEPYDTILLYVLIPMLLAIALSPSRLKSVRDAIPACSLAALFFLLPVIDIAIIYTLSVLQIAGFSIDPSGSFGGPLDCRLRHGRAFVASAAITLAVDFFWKKYPPHVLARHLLNFRIQDGRPTFTFNFNEPAKLGCCLVLVVTVVFAAIPMLRYARDIKNVEVSMRALAVRGANFSALYAQPDLRALAAANPEFGAYRVATVQLQVDSDGTKGAREASLYGTYLNGYRFETADAYMSNLPRRYVNFWDLLLTGHPAFPRSEFDKRFAQKFMRPEQAFLQKLYLFEPLASKAIDADGCVRTETPIKFSDYYNLNLLSLANVTFIVSGIPLDDPNLDLLESRTRADLRALQCAPAKSVRAAFHGSGLIGWPLYIYRNKLALPRVFTPPAMEVLPDDDAVYQALASRPVEQLRNTALVVRSEMPPEAAPASTPFEARIDRVTTVRGDHLKIEARSTTGGLIVVANAFSPFWQASTASQPLPTFPVYHAFIGIWVPPGEHVIDLRYRPPYARWLPW